VPLAAVYVQSGSANVTQIEDIRPIIGFRAAGVNASAVHGNLLGLSADDHTQYLLVDGGRQMSGDLGLGGNDLYNFASLSGSSITASGANITNILATTINATSITGSLLGIAATASYVAQAVSASFASTASFVNPLTQNVQITGSLNISGSTAISTSNAISITAPGNGGNFITFNSTGNSTNASIGQQNGLLNSNKSFSIQGDRLTFVNSAFSATYASMVASSTSGNISLIPSGSGILIVSGGLTVTGSTQITGSLNAPNITGSLFGTASWAQNAINALTASSADNFVIRQNITASNALFSGTVTAQTLVVQTITSSTDFVTGSTRFGSLLTNTHQFTGSVSVTGSFALASLTATRIPYVGTGGILQDSAKLTYDDTGANSTIKIYPASSTRTASEQAGIILYDRALSGISGASGSYTTVNQVNSGATPEFRITAAANGSDVSPRIVISTSNFLSLQAAAGNGNVLVGTNTDSGFKFEVSGSARINNLTGSLFGTASWAQNVVTASYILQAVSASFASTASFVTTAQTASYVLNAVSSSFSTNAATASFVVLAQTASFVTTAQTASYVQTAQTASYVQLAQSASYVLQAVSSSFASTASFVTLAQTASYVQLAQSASYILQAVSSSFATTASYAANGGVTAFNTRVGAITLLSTDISGLGAGIVSSSTFSSPSQGTLRATINGAQTDVDLGLQTGDSVSFAQVTASFTGSLTGALIGTASWAQNVVNASTASYVLQAVSASFATTSSFATTASYAANGGVTSFNTRVGAVTLTAGDISGLGAGIISGSTFSSPSQGTLRTVINGVQTDVDLGLQTADNVQFAQITGSNALFTGTLTAQTLVVQTVTSSTDFVTGSTRFGSLLTNTHQFTGSVTITGSLAVSGPATLNNLTGSLFGTASWAQNVVTASYVTGSVFSSTNPALSASFATTASYAANGGVTAFNTRVGAVTLQASDISGLGAGILSSSAFSSPSQGTLRATINGVQTDVDLGLQTADNVQFAQVTASFTGSLTGALIGTASWATNVIAAQTASFINNNALNQNLTITGSLTLSSSAAVELFVIGNTQFTGSVGSTGGFTGSLFGTASYVTGSVFSSANPALTASFAITSSFASTAATATQVGANLTQGTGITAFTYNGSSAQTVAVAGASTLTTNELVKWNGTAFADSNIFDNGTNVFITASSVIVSGASSALIVTGSVRSTGGFTGSLFGTASYVTGALFTSTNPALTASYAVTAAFALNAGGAASPITVADEGTAQGTATFLNFVGTGVSATVTSNTASITINTGGSAFPFTGSALVTGSFGVTGSLSVTSSGGFNQFGNSQFSGSVTSLFGYTGSLFGTASNAITASYALNAGAGGLQTKAGSVANTTFAGNPKKATVTFSTAFSNTSYAIVITGEDARSWTIESKVAGSFVINANSNTSLAGTTYWIATAYGET
jgi:hypothetical protein